MTAGDSNSPVFSFTSLDYSTMLADLLAYAQRTFTDQQWTDFNSSNSLTGVVELLAYACDALGYNYNASVLETIASTLIREQSFRWIAKSHGYTMHSATPSSSTRMRVLGLSANPLLYPFNIEAELQFSTEDGSIFQPQAPVAVTWPPDFDGTDGYYVDVAVVQGDEHNDNLGPSNGKADQRFLLGTSSVIDGTLSVTVNGVPYAQVDDATSYGPSDTIYLVETDEELITSIIFGDGINGIIPPLGHTVLANYKTGGGLHTNYPVGVELSVTGGLAPVPSALSSASARFLVAATGGGDRQSLRSAQRALPALRKANDRAVVEEDYAGIAVAEVSGVYRARGVQGAPIGGSRPIYLPVVPMGFGNPSVSLINLIMTTIKKKRMAGKRVIVRDPLYVYLSVQVGAYVLPRAGRLATGQRLVTALLTKYNSENLDFGHLFGLQNAYDNVSPSVIPGLRRALFKRFSVLPYYGRYLSKNTVGSGTVEGIEVVWDTLRRREWMIRILAPDPVNGIFCSRFLVRRRILGEATGVFDDLVIDEQAAFEDGELVGLKFHPNHEETNDSIRWNVTGNTSQTISVAGVGLLNHLTVGDPYAIEADEPRVGKILQATVVYPASGILVFVSSARSFLYGDQLRCVDTNGTVTRVTCLSTVMAGNVISDSTMEAAGVLYWISVNNALLTKNETAPYKGTRNLRVAYTDTANPKARPFTALVVGYQYTITGYGKGDGTHSPVLWVDGVAVWTGTPDAAWQAFSFTTIATTATPIELGMIAAAGYVEFDEVYVNRTATLVVSSAISLQVGAKINVEWVSSDGSLRFSLVNGTTPFAIGDELYVDTYEEEGDIQIRPEAFPLLLEENIEVEPVGGI